QVQAGLTRVNINEMMENVSSKRDIYLFLNQECEAYLPKMDTINIFSLKQVMRGTKEVSQPWPQLHSTSSGRK
ncbi:MAG: hypothetical protein ACK56F_12800, partial [bacterium]